MRMLGPTRANLRHKAAMLREYGWTQQQIANALNLPQRTISYWLSRPIVAISNRDIVAKDMSFSNNGRHDDDQIMEMISNMWVDPDLSRQYALKFQTNVRQSVGVGK